MAIFSICIYTSVLNCQMAWLHIDDILSVVSNIPKFDLGPSKILDDNTQYRKNKSGNNVWRKSAFAECFCNIKYSQY